MIKNNHKGNPKLQVGIKKTLKNSALINSIKDGVVKYKKVVLNTIRDWFCEGGEGCKMYIFIQEKYTLSTSSLISPSFQGAPTIFYKGFSTNKPIIWRINLLWGSCNILHPPFSCLNERAQTF